MCGKFEFFSIYSWLIKLSEPDLLICCASRQWARTMAEHSFPNPKEVLATADSVWWGLTEDERREAIAGLAPIEDRQDLAEATPEIMARIGVAAARYHERHHQRFITTVLGKTGLQILQLIVDRTERDGANAPRANAEQALQVARNRLKRLLPKANS